MNQQSTPHWLRLCTLGLSLFIGSTSLATPPQPTAQELYAQGDRLFTEGRMLEAREVLLRADLTQLERAQRQALLTMINRIDDSLRKMPEAQVRLMKAELAVRQADYRTATSHLELIRKSAASTPEQKSQAEQMLATVRSAQSDLAPHIPLALQKAISAFDSGNFGEAKAGLNLVYNSGVALDLDQQKDLTRYIEQITMLEAQRGKFATPVVNVSVMQDPPAQDPPAQEPPVEEPPAQEPPADDNKNQDLIYQAQQAQAKIYFDQAQQALANGQYAAAAELFQKVLAVQPDNQAARDGLQKAQDMLNVGNILPQQQETRQVQVQQLKAEFNNLMSQARARMAQGEFIDATNLVMQARYRVQEGRIILPTPDYESMREQTMTLAGEIETAKRQAEQRESQARAEDIAKRRAEDQARIEAERQQRIAQRLLAIRKSQAAQRYDEALLECNALLFEDPGNPAGLALRDTLQDLRALRKWDLLKREGDVRHVENSLVQMEASLIPKGIVEYPPDWPELSARRLDLAYTDTEADRKVWNALARQRANVDFRGTPLGDVLTWIGEVANVNIDVEWKALEENFIDRNMPINLRLNDQVNLQVVLERTLAQLATDARSRPDFAVQDGILMISTKERLAANPVVHMYPIGDLLVNIPHFDNAKSLDLEAEMNRKAESRESLKASLFGQGDIEKYDRGRDRREELIEKIREVITTTIDSTSWQINGGDVGVIQTVNSNLIIKNTARNHQAISNLLSKLREIQSIQINVDSRFLTINESWFEQVGIDLDIYFGGSEYQRAAALDPNILPIDLFTDPISGEVRRGAGQRQYTSIFDLVPTGTFDDGGRETFNQEVPPSGVIDRSRRTWSPSSIQQNTLGLARSIFDPPAESMASGLLAMDPAFSYGISFLNDIQVDLLIEATQADRRSNQITSPKLTFFNGQRSFVQVTTSRFFISDLQPVVGDSSAGFDPDLQAVNEGVVLDVEGTVSADRRYVTMTVSISNSSLIDLVSTSIPIVVGGRVLDSGEPNDIIANTAEIQRPVTQVSAVNTTVSVPDRGTILLGGQTIRNNIEVETGVPVLSKIPIINRFFTNRIDTVEEKTLLILLKPTIIIQQEQEDLLYPGLQDSLRAGGFNTSF